MKHALVVLILLGAAGARAADADVTMRNKSFSTPEVSIKVGDKVAFHNGDPFVHNIFSMTEPGSFDLGTYPEGEVRKVEFKEAGVHEVECAIHPEMKMKVNVTK